MSLISADKLRQEIQNILKDADLNTLSSKKVRQMLEALFKCDFTERKKEIDEILMAEITTRDIQPIPTNPIDNQGQSQTSNEEDSQGNTMKTQADDNNQPTSKSGEESPPMEIQQQENRPSIRQSIVSQLKRFSFERKKFISVINKYNSL
jgi:hypothetical protein